MRTSPPATFSMPLSALSENDLFDLPDVPADYREPEMLAPTWEEQLAHAQLLLSWQNQQNAASVGVDRKEVMPRNPEPFVM